MAGYTPEQMTKARKIFERVEGFPLSESINPIEVRTIRAALYAMGVTELVPIIDNNFIIVRKNYRVENYDSLVNANLDSCSDDKARVIIPTGKFDF